VLLEAHFPGFAGLGQFRPHILTLEKQANGIGIREILCIPKQLVERRTGASRHDIEGQAFDSLHAFISDFRIQFEPLADFLEKGAFLGDGLEQRYASAAA
jgi:hypothetical protein